jgi:WD40 repeat protein
MGDSKGSSPLPCASAYNPYAAVRMVRPCISADHALGSLQRVQGHQGGVYDLMLLREGLVVSGGADDSCVKLWALGWEGEVAKLVCRAAIVAHTQPVYALAVLDTRIASASYDRSIKVREGDRGQGIP